MPYVHRHRTEASSTNTKTTVQTADLAGTALIRLPNKKVIYIDPSLGDTASEGSFHFEEDHAE